MTARIKISGEQGSEAFEHQTACPFTLEMDGELFTIRAGIGTSVSGEYAKGDKVVIEFE